MSSKLFGQESLTKPVTLAQRGAEVHCECSTPWPGHRTPSSCEEQQLMQSFVPIH